MSDFTSSWRENLLRQAGIPVTRFAKDVLDAWQRSTPLDGWTNNPLGYPFSAGQNVPALNTPYAAFPSMQAFRKAMTAFLASPKGRDVFAALATQDKPSVAWRAINSLGWPGSKFETDYPAAVFDLTDDAYRASVRGTDSSDRKTTGVVGGGAGARKSSGRPRTAIQETTGTLSSGARAMRELLKGRG